MKYEICYSDETRETIESDYIELPRTSESIFGSKAPQFFTFYFKKVLILAVSAYKVDSVRKQEEEPVLDSLAQDQ